MKLLKIGYEIRPVANGYFIRPTHAEQYTSQVFYECYIAKDPDEALKVLSTLEAPITLAALK